mgnify:CR=1 FL=1
MASSYLTWMTRLHGVTRLMDAQQLKKLLDHVVDQLFMFNAQKIQTPLKL